MSKIPYLQDQTPAENMDRLRTHLGITNVELAEKSGLRVSVVQKAIEHGFKTAGGQETDNTKEVKKRFASYFTGGIPSFEATPIVDLFSLMGCADCEYRSRSHEGCLKFSFSKAEINRGPYMHTLKHGSFTLSKSKPCIYANGQA